jgi:hypothetical protein
MSDEKEIQRVFLIGDLSGYTALTEAHRPMEAFQPLRSLNVTLKLCRSVFTKMRK